MNNHIRAIAIRRYSMHTETHEVSCIMYHVFSTSLIYWTNKTGIITSEIYTFKLHVCCDFRYVNIMPEESDGWHLALEYLQHAILITGTVCEKYLVLTSLTTTTTTTTTTTAALLHLLLVLPLWLLQPAPLLLPPSFLTTFGLTATDLHLWPLDLKVWSLSPGAPKFWIWSNSPNGLWNIMITRAHRGTEWQTAREVNTSSIVLTMLEV